MDIVRSFVGTFWPVLAGAAYYGTDRAVRNHSRIKSRVAELERANAAAHKAAASEHEYAQRIELAQIQHGVRLNKLEHAYRNHLPPDPAP